LHIENVKWYYSQTESHL